MAEFNIKPETQLPGNYTGASQGIRTSPNTALGTLFEGLAETLDMGIKEADRATQEQIREDIFDEVDAIQDEFGVSSATMFQEDTESPTTPRQLQDAGRHLAGLQAAYERGGLKESHYWARLNSMVRQIRAKYPGYRAEIDGMVSGIVGARPANALRNALFNEWEAEATTMSDLEKLEDWATKNGHMPADYDERAASGNPYSFTEFRAYVSERTAREQNTQNARNQLALAADQGTATTRQIEIQARSEMTSFVSGILTDSMGTLGSTFQTLQDRILDAGNQAAGGTPLPADQVAAMRGQIGQIKTDMRLAIEQKLNESWDGNPQHSYSAQLDQAQIDAIINRAMEPVLILEDAILNENYGVVNQVSAYLKASQEAAAQSLLAEAPVLSVLQGMQSLMGETGAEWYMRANPSLQSALETTLIGHWSNLAATGNGSIVEAYDQLEQAGASSAAYDALITKWTRVIDQVGSGEIPAETIANNVDFMFGQDALSTLAVMDDASKYQYFKKVASPRVTQQMIKLRDMGEVEAWNTYQTWVSGAFMALFQSGVQAIPSDSFDSRGIRVIWDPNTVSFKIDTSGPRPDFFSAPNPLQASTQISRGAGYDQVRRVNEAIHVIAPIISENDGTVEEEIFDLLLQMGYDPNRQPDPDLIESAGQLLGNALAMFFGENDRVEEEASGGQDS